MYVQGASLKITANLLVGFFNSPVTIGLGVVISNSFNQLLNFYWLRPETALWREIDIRTMQDFEFESPALDLGCGDGVFSFIRAGGKFDTSFDAFRSVDNLDKFFEKTDVFDAFKEGFKPLIKQASRYRISIGFDHKPNLLKKAGCLDFYDHLKEGDANGILPFEDNSFNSIFSNIVYWLDDPYTVLQEIKRILKPGGRCCLMLPDSMMPEFSFYNQLYVKTGDEQWKFLEKLDRGRFADNIKQAKSRMEWEAIFKAANLHIVSHKMHLSKITIQAWDIGFRPLFPVLLEMANALPKETLLSIKAKWMETLRMFLEPMIELDFFNSKTHAAFHCFVLRK